MEMTCSIIVTVLSTLVLILIGWQIYSLIDFRESAKKVDNATNVVNFQVEKLNLSTGMALSDFYYMLLTDDKRNVMFKYIHYSVIAIMHASNIKDIKTCNAVTKTILEVIVAPEKIKLSKYHKKLIFDIITEVKYGNEIEQYGDLLQVLSKIDVL